jgi:small multidrug resistance family-3 protein
MTVLRSVLLFAVAALAEIGGAWLVWQGVREHRGLAFVGAGILALGLYGFVATFQPDPHFGRILAAYGGVFVAGSLAWGMLVDGFRPDRYDLVGAALCLAGVAVIMYAPRAGWIRPTRTEPEGGRCPRPTRRSSVGWSTRSSTAATWR